MDLKGKIKIERKQKLLKARKMKEWVKTIMEGTVKNGYSEELETRAIQTKENYGIQDKICNWATNYGC
ncbi:hypothetical protein L2E82_05979 [Cichorium intybus]|uniref:Uncharacterized protein n=1 Tax=Cichorium intybus TaxID=13427 RepID=A0ACB9H8U5_CICIN|nr:hypothetical protein L2E82_05979 [Cichorium intybus]